MNSYPPFSESATRVAAVKTGLDDLFDDRPEITIVPLEPALVFGDEPLEMMEKHPVKNGAFRMMRAVDSRHTGNEVSRNAPGAGLEPASRDNDKKWYRARFKKRQKPSTFVDARSSNFLYNWI
jgi:hypothetical protein